MRLKNIVLSIEVTSALLAMFLNTVLLICIFKKTTISLKPYSKILRQNCFVDMFYTFVILVTFLVGRRNLNVGLETISRISFFDEP